MYCVCNERGTGENVLLSLSLNAARNGDVWKHDTAGRGILVARLAERREAAGRAASLDVRNDMLMRFSRTWFCECQERGRYVGFGSGLSCS